jgi:hypothetical protein
MRAAGAQSSRDAPGVTLRECSADSGARYRARALVMFASLFVASVAMRGVVAATDIDLLERISELDTPALLLVFIWLLATGRVVWKRELERERAETETWREAAVGRTIDHERSLTVAEAALAAADRRRR